MLLISILILQTVQAYPIFKPDKLQNVNILLNALDYLETQGNDTFTTLKAFWIQNPEYLNSLEQIGPLTIFAPTDAAYYKLPVNIWQDKNATFENLKYHIINTTLVFKSISADYYTKYPTLTNDSLLVGRFNGTLRALGGKQSVANSVKNDVTIRKVSVISIDTVLETPSSLNVELLHYPFTRNTSMVIDKQLLGSSFTLLLPPNGTFRALEKKICNTGTFYPQDITYLVKALSLNETLAVPADLYESSFSSTNISTIGNYTIQFQSNLNQTLFGVNGSFAGIISDSNHLVQGGIIHYLANFTFPGLRKQDLKCSNSSSLQF